MRLLYAVVGLGMCSAVAAQDMQLTSRPLQTGGVGEATLYHDPEFSGSAVGVTGARADLGLRWKVRSIRVERGTWQLCERKNFEGKCFHIDSSQRQLPNDRRTVQSMRPVYDGGWELVGEREVRDASQRDTIISWGHTGHRQVRICVEGQTVRFYDVELVYFFNGKKEVPVRTFISDGQCTRDIDLEGVKDISFVNMVYETFSLGNGRAIVQVYARQ